eukprot:gene5800-biopygen5788
MARRGAGCRQLLVWVARAWRGHCAGVARACPVTPGANVRNHLCGGWNVQGRQLNGSPRPCTQWARSSRASCRFIPLEQDGYLRRRPALVVAAIFDVSPRTPLSAAPARRRRRRRGGAAPPLRSTPRWLSARLSVPRFFCPQRPCCCCAAAAPRQRTAAPAVAPARRTPQGP